MFMTLIHNTTLLIALSVLWTPILLLRKRYVNLYRVLSGLLFGFSAIAAMMTPLNFAEGVIYDGRSVVIALSALYGGGIASLIASIIAAGYRIWLGGSGVYAGVASVMVSAIIGLALRRKYRNQPAHIPVQYIIAFAIIVHIAVLFCQLLLPWPMGIEVMKKIGFIYVLTLSSGLATISFFFSSIETRTIALQQLHASADYLQDILSISPSILFTIDVSSGTIIWISPNIKELIGFHPGETTAQKWLFRHIHPDDHKKFSDLLTSLSEADSASTVCRFYDKHENELCMDMKLKILPGKNNDPTTAIGSMNDITKRTKLARQLSESEELFRLIFNNAPVGIFAFDSAGKITAMNENFVSIIGSSHEAILNLDIMKLPDPRVTDAMQRCLQGEKVYLEGEYHSVTADKSTFVSAVFSPLIVEGNTVGGIAIAEDISEKMKIDAQRKKLEEQLRHSQKLEALGRLVGGIAHDFNNILSIISGYTEIAKEKSLMGETINSELDEIKHAVDRSTEIIRQLLTFTRHKQMQPERINLNDVIRQSRKMLSTLIGENIELRLDLKDDLEEIIIDRAMFIQIMTNLASNSRDAIRDTGTITITTENKHFDEEFCASHPQASPGSYILFKFTDTGCGISKKDIDKIFEPFYTTKEVGKGTGLGLSIVYSIANEFKGFITVYSEVGTGTTFNIFSRPLLKKKMCKKRRTSKRKKIPSSAALFWWKMIR
jgi:PAS domain S-box-containing protein